MKKTGKYINPIPPKSGLNRWKKISLWISMGCLAIFAFFGISANVIANKNPLYIYYQGKHLFPALQEQVYLWDAWQKTDRVSWDTLQAESIVWPLIPYNTAQKLKHERLAPFAFPTQIKAGKEVAVGARHWLGTDLKGRDILASIIHGARRSLGIAIFTLFIIVLIGIPLGGLAAYYQDNKLRIQRAKAWLFIPGCMLAWFYGFQVRTFPLTKAGESFTYYFLQFVLSLAIFSLVLFACLSISRLFPKNRFLNISIPLKLDTFISRFMELVQSLPGLLLVITLSAFLGSQNIWLVMFILATVSWINIARVVRAQVLSIKERNYILAAKASGIPNWRIITQHILPNSLSSIWPMLAFGIGSIILAESGLSFLGLIEGSEASWGGLVTAGKDNWKLWWISLFPGICIFLTVFSCNILGERLRDILDPYSQ